MKAKKEKSIIEVLATASSSGHSSSSSSGGPPSSSSSSSGLPSSSGSSSSSRSGSSSSSGSGSGSPRLLQNHHQMAEVRETVITAHHCSPEMLRKIDQWPFEKKNRSIVMYFNASHRTWRSPMKLLSDGFFTGGGGSPNGQWKFQSDGDTLILNWFDWPRDVLNKTPFGYANSELRLELFDKVALNEDVPSSTSEIRLHLGCGANILNDWENYDFDMDLRLPLPFAEGSVRFVFAEHVIEHVTASEAWKFLKEARRVLRPGGGMRIIVPCVDLILQRYDAAYGEFIRRSTSGGGSLESAMDSIICNWGHKAVWTQETLLSLLKALGFKAALARPGESHFPELCGIDGHAACIGEHANWVESGVVEAVKWVRSRPDGSKEFPGWDATAPTV